MSGDTVISILQRLVDASQGRLSAAAAEAVLQIRFSDADQTRISELADKSNQGTLACDEADEYDNYIAAADFLSLWKARARLSLKKQPSAV
jgi:hypothetical protein